MKRLAIFAIFLLLLLPARGQRRDFVIEGELSGVKDGAVLSLMIRHGDMGMGVKNDTLRGGRFRFVYPLDAPQRFSIAGMGAEHFERDYASGPEIWGEPGLTVVVRGDGLLSRGWRVESPLPEQRLWTQLRDASRAEYARLDSVEIVMDRTRKMLGGAEGEARQALEGTFDALLEQLKTISREIAPHTLDILERTEVSDLWLGELHSAVRFHLEDQALRPRILALYDRLTDEQKTLAPALQITALLHPPADTVGVGEAMADAELRVWGGGTRKLSDFLNRGRHVLLDFWASGCGPCYAAMPEMRELTERLGDELTIVGINLDAADESWEMSLEMFGPVTWANLNAPAGSDIAARYGVSAYPTQFLISPEGKILETWVGYGPGTIEKTLAKYREAE